MDVPERQERAFGWITDGAREFDAEMESRAKDPDRSKADHLADAFRKEGAQMLADRQEAALRAAYPAAT